MDNSLDRALEQLLRELGFLTPVSSQSSSKSVDLALIQLLKELGFTPQVGKPVWSENVKDAFEKIFTHDRIEKETGKGGVGSVLLINATEEKIDKSVLETLKNRGWPETVLHGPVAVKLVPIVEPERLDQYLAEAKTTQLFAEAKLAPAIYDNSGAIPYKDIPVAFQTEADAVWKRVSQSLRFPANDSQFLILFLERMDETLLEFLLNQKTKKQSGKKPTIASNPDQIRAAARGIGRLLKILHDKKYTHGDLALFNIMRKTPASGINESSDKAHQWKFIDMDSSTTKTVHYSPKVDVYRLFSETFPSTASDTKVTEVEQTFSANVGKTLRDELEKVVDPRKKKGEKDMTGIYDEYDKDNSPRLDNIRNNSNIQAAWANYEWNRAYDDYINKTGFPDKRTDDENKAA